MKIVHIINYMGSGGVETFLKNLIFEQAKTHEITLITLIDNNTYNFDDFLSIKDKVSFIEFPYKKMYDVRIVFRIRNILKHLQPNVVHTHLFPGQFIIPISTFGIKSKLFTTEHGISLRRKKYPLFHYLEKISFSKYKKIICVSEAVNEKLKEEYPELSDKIITINNGIDIEKIVKTKKVLKEELSDKFLEDDIIVCMVGRIDIGKDYETLIRSMKLLPDNYKLLIVGQGYKRLALEKLVENLDLEKRVDFFGFKKDIYNIYKTIDIFVLSSEREGLPMVLLEAMSAQKPCIGSNVDGIKTLLVDVSILFEYQNDKDLANKILYVNNNYKIYSEKSYYCVQNYSFNKMFESYEKTYKENQI